VQTPHRSARPIAFELLIRALRRSRSWPATFSARARAALDELRKALRLAANSTALLARLQASRTGIVATPPPATRTRPGGRSEARRRSLRKRAAAPFRIGVRAARAPLSALGIATTGSRRSGVGRAGRAAAV
jgi:hypothetical protein